MNISVAAYFIILIYEEMSSIVEGQYKCEFCDFSRDRYNIIEDHAHMHVGLKICKSNILNNSVSKSEYLKVKVEVDIKIKHKSDTKSNMQEKNNLNVMNAIIKIFFLYIYI